MRSFYDSNTQNDSTAEIDQQALRDTSPPVTKSSTDFRALFISDVHLGTKDCKAKELNAFLKQHTFDRLYLVGDIFDGWKMRKKIHWHKHFNRLLRRVLKLSKNGVEITYITGNHDEFLRKYANSNFDNIKLVNKTTHVTKDNRKLLVIHGDQFETVTHCGRIWKFAGDNGYDLLMFLNRSYNRIRARFGYGYWSFAGFLKSHIKKAQTYIGRYEVAVSHQAARRGFDGVVCGHIHHAAIKELEGITYYNTGDWVESCTAIAENHDGEFLLIDWLKTQEKSESYIEPAIARAS